MDEAVRFSQNFLRDARLIDLLLDKTNIKENDIVYDIGAGTGAITSVLAKRCSVVVAVEIDKALIKKLYASLDNTHNVVVYDLDFLNMPLPAVPYKVFANIPYNISAEIVRKLTSHVNPPSSMYLVVQREFAQKITPGSNGRTSQMAALLGVRFVVSFIQQLRRSDFTPRPRVESVCIEIQQRTRPLVSDITMQLFRDFIAYTYNAHKLDVRTSLRSIFNKSEFTTMARRLGFELGAVPTQLDAEQWAALFNEALKRRHALSKLVAGYESRLEKKHSARISRHRTRR